MISFSDYIQSIFVNHYRGVRDTYAVGGFTEVAPEPDSRSFCRGGAAFQMGGHEVRVGHNILDLFDLYIDGRLRFEDVSVEDFVPRLTSAMEPVSVSIFVD